MPERKTEFMEVILINRQEKMESCRRSCVFSGIRTMFFKRFQGIPRLFKGVSRVTGISINVLQRISTNSRPRSSGSQPQQVQIFVEAYPYSYHRDTFHPSPSHTSPWCAFPFYNALSYLSLPSSQSRQYQRISFSHATICLRISDID